MKIKKIISKSPNGQRMEVVAENKHGLLQTLHLHRFKSGWRYCKEYDYEKDEVRVFGAIEGFEEEEKEK